MRPSIVEVAVLEEGENKRITFQGDSIQLADAVKRAGYDLEDYAQVLRNESEIPTGQLEEATVRNGDVIFLVPVIVGG